MPPAFQQGYGPCREDYNYAVVINFTFAFSLNNCSLYKSWTNQLASIDLCPLALPTTLVPLRSLHSHSCAKANLLSALVFLTGYPADAWGPWSAEGLPIAALPCLPAGLQSEFTATVKTSVSSQRERGDRKRAQEQYGILPPLKQMPGHADSPTQRAFEISSLVNSCLMEARRENAWRSLNGDTKASFSQALKFSFSPYCSIKQFPAALPCQFPTLNYLFQVQSGFTAYEKQSAAL